MYLSSKKIDSGGEGGGGGGGVCVCIIYQEQNPPAIYLKMCCYLALCLWFIISH
jgi:hypothetical protein